MSELGSMALPLAARGLRVFLVHSVTKRADGTWACTCQGRGDCSSPGKHPITEHGCNDATTDEKQIRQWARQFPNANVGVATGAGSGVWVLDIDPRHGGDVTLEEWTAAYGPLLETWQVLTGGGGRHYYFRHPGGRIPCITGLGPGVDVKGDGGLVVAPYSRHVSGRSYEWELSSSPEDVPLADAPAWLLQLLQRHAEPKTAAPVVAEAIPEGTRNKTLTSLAGTMRRRGMGEPEILAALKATNATRCKPALSDSEVAKIAHSVTRYSPEEAAELVIGKRAPEPSGNGKALKTITAAELAGMDLPAPVWVVDGLVCEGLGILSGAPKIGKSWLALGIAIAVASGGKVLGNLDVSAQGDVLYLALEDSLRRLRERLHFLDANALTLPTLHLQTACPRLGSGGIEALEEWKSEHPGCRLVVADTWARIRPRVNPKAGAYMDDTEAAAPLQAFAMKHHVAVLIVHHKRKQSDSDFLNEASGSTGLTGVADAILSIQRARGEADATLHVTGRDVPDAKLALRFNAGEWQFIGDAEEYRLSKERREVLDLVREHGPITQIRLAEMLEKPRGSVARLCAILVSDRLLDSSRSGYTITNTPNTTSKTNGANIANIANTSKLASASVRLCSGGSAGGRTQGSGYEPNDGAISGAQDSLCSECSPCSSEEDRLLATEAGAWEADVIGQEVAA